MTARVRGWRQPSVASVDEEGNEAVVEERVYRGDQSADVTAATIDEAVVRALKNAQIGDSAGTVLKDLLATDSSSTVAHAYFNDKARLAIQQTRVQAARRPLVVPYALHDEQAAELAKYAVEFNLQFVGRDVHDHPVAAAMRTVDRALVRSRVPPGVKFIDVGGAVMPHIKDGVLGSTVHVCAPLYDRKDGARLTLQKLEARKVFSSAESTDHQRAAAGAYLDKKPEAVCGLRAQECGHRARVATSVHVYDIPMADWPYIMSRRHIDVVEGCLLFSPKVFGDRVGTFDSVGARYEVDVDANTFTMGFVDSPAMLYEHPLDEYLAYGVDQVVHSAVGTYSYKIIERRGDTVFFRILRVSDDTVAVRRPVFRMPGVPVVEVLGFDPEARAGQGFSGMARVKYVWPEPLWDAMVSHAILQAERGQLTHELMFNFYRTIAPRQTINSTLVFGGHTVSLKELLPLIVNSVLAGMSEWGRAKKETGAIVATAVARRERLIEKNVMKVAKMFWDALKVVASVPFAPLVWLANLVDDGARAMLQSQSVEWEPIASVREVDFSLIADVCTGGKRGSSVGEVPVPDFVHDYEEAAELDPMVMALDDPVLARKVLDSMQSALPADYVRQLKEVAVDRTPPPSYKSHAGSTVAESVVAEQRAQRDDAKVRERRAAVEEAIVESKLEQRHVAAACAVAARELMVGGKPSDRAVENFREEHKNPEFWWVERGIIARSSSNAPATDFVKAAVYLMRPCRDTGEHVCPVYVEEVVVQETAEVREYSRVKDSTYTGWALTTDYLSVYNGPEIVATMQRALDEGSFDFNVVLEQGPPGCGKTTAVVNSMRAGDYVMSPARESCRDTKEKIRELHGEEGTRLAEWVRTLDSYLVNYGLRGKLRAVSATRLLADECFMSRYGKWCAAAALLRVATVVGFGDRQQIPHVPRVSAPRMHLAFKTDEEAATWLTYRCPATAVASWGSKYEWRVRSASGREGTLREVTTTGGLEIPDGCVMMGMYQADKKVIKQMYSGRKARFQVMTVHESQGKTFKHVWLHRFDARKRTDTFSLYDREEYVLVAMSRHTESFVYVTPPVGDLVSRWLERGKSVRRVTAAADVTTAGQSKEFA